jgi:hypothetical protein
MDNNARGGQNNIKRNIQEGCDLPVSQEYFMDINAKAEDEQTILTFLRLFCNL